MDDEGLATGFGVETGLDECVGVGVGVGVTTGVGVGVGVEVSVVAARVGALPPEEAAGGGVGFPTAGSGPQPDASGVTTTSAASSSFGCRTPRGTLHTAGLGGP